MIKISTFKAFFKTIFSILFFVLISSFSNLSAQISTLNAWTNAYNGTANYTANYTVPTGSNTNRLLVVAVSTTTRAASTRSITLTYGTQTLTAINGDLGSTTRQHTQFYYLNEAGLDAASTAGSSSLVFAVTGGTTALNSIFLSVYDNVDQTSPITDSKVLNSGSGTTSSVAFGTALTVNANDLALKVISSVQTGSTTIQTITGFGTSWNINNEQTATLNFPQTSNDLGIRNAIGKRSIPGTNLTDVSTVTLSGATLASMTGVSLKYAPPTITTTDITGTSFCAGASVSVPFTITGAFVGVNVFTAQLSNAAGSFASPVSIGTLTSTAAGSISATLPSNTTTGTGYRIRVVSSTPAITGSDNGTNLSIFSFPSAPTTTGNFICIGTPSGTILSASGAVSGEVYKWYSAASAGTLLKTSTNNLDNTYTTPTISATTSYWVSISNAGGCETARTQVTATFPSASVANQTTAATNSWIGHIYDGTNLNTYYGTTTQLETFDQSFSGQNTCFGFTSGANSLSIHTESFSVRYRMNSTKKGLYIVDLGADDGSRLYVDGNLVYNNWSDQAYTSKPRVLISLTGSSPLIYDFYENGGQNRVVFQNLISVLSNTLTTNTTQTISTGTTGTTISGDVYGTLPTGVSLSGTGYQWTYSTTLGGSRTNIAGATGATFTPDATVAPFNAGGTFYIYRNAVLSSSNNISPNPYIATNESNAATVNVNLPTITSSVSSLTGFSYLFNNGPSTEQSFTVEGTNLTNNITLTSPTNYEFSLTSGSGFQSTPITLNQTGGTVATTSIYVRLKTGLSVGDYNSQNIIASSTNAASLNISCSGSVTSPIYCASSGNITWQTSITLVKFNTINKTSTKISGYDDNTGLATLVSKNNTYNLSVNLNTDGNYIIHAVAWIDWNQNGNFTDVGEVYNLGTASNIVDGATTLSPLTITVPGTALLGNTRMRVSAKFSVAPTACETSFDGEVEDYTLVVTPNGTPYLMCTPTSISSFTYPYTAGPSAIQSFKVFGNNLTENVIVSASNSFEVSLFGGSSFSSQPFVTVPASGGAVNQLVYVRMKAGLNTGAVAAENLILSTAGATNATVSCSGTVTAQPEIIVSTNPATNPVSVSGFTATYGGAASPTKNFTVSGTNLVGNVVLAAPTGYEIKTSIQTATQYVTSLTLTPTSSTLAETTINVRLKSGLGVGSYSGNIVGTSSNATSKTVVLTGIVSPVATLTTSTSWLAGFIYSGVGASASQSFQLIGTNLSADVTVTPPTNFELSSDNVTWFSTAFTVARVGNGVNKTMYARLKANLTAGVAYGPENVSLSSTGAVIKTVALSGYVANTPTILVSKSSLNGFGYLFGTGPSVTQKVNVSGALLTNDISVAPPANFEILNPSTGLYQTTPITLTRTGTTVDATEVTLRLAAGLTALNFSGNLVASSTGASSKNVALTGKVFASPLISSGGGGTYCLGETIYLTSTGVDVENQFWTGPNSYYSILPNPTITNATTQMSGNYTVTGNVTVGGNLIVNGDFEMGNVGFSSSYAYAAPVASALVPEGLYTVTTFASDVHYNFNSVPDTTVIGTQQMVINGNTTAGAVVWTQSVPVVPGSEYEFTYWLQTVVKGTDPAPSKLQLYVNGDIAGPIYTAIASTGIWTQYLYNTASGTNNILNLELINQTTDANGNDFALDSIVFKQILSATSTQNVQVAPSVTPSVAVTHSPTNVYQNAPVVFTATPVNGGTTPSYKWFVGGVEQLGQTDNTFSYTPTGTGSLTVSCEMTSSIACAQPNPVNGSELINVQTPLVNYWMGGIDTDWGKAGNWTANYVPAAGDNVIYATVSNYGSAAVRNLQLDINRTIGSLINATIRSLIIPPSLTLIVNNIINVTPPVTVPVTKAEDLILIKASDNLPNGSLKYNNPQNNQAYGTVEMYSPASWNKAGGFNNVYQWQFFGIPVSSLPTLPTFYGAYVRELIESDKDTATHWRSLTNTSTIQPFIGYELCQQNPKFYTFKGQLVNSNYNSGQFVKTLDALYPGQHLFANPYTAAMDIKLIEFGDGVEATAYLYSTGTFLAWRNIRDQALQGLGSAPGQYFAVPKNQAGQFGIPRQVPSMGTLMVRIPAAQASTELSYVNFNYSTVTMANTDLQRTKSSSTTDNQTTTTIDIEGENGADRIWIMSHESYTRSFDNGFDGKKLTGNALSPQFYSVESDGNYQINSVDDINNTTLAFQAGQDTEYKMTIKHDESTLAKYTKIYLHDLVENRVIDISLSGTEYVFNASSKTNTKLRFKILSQKTENVESEFNYSKVYTYDNKIFVQNFSNTDGTVYVYDISGRTIGIKPIKANENIQFSAPANVVYIVKRTINSQNELTKVFLK